MNEAERQDLRDFLAMEVMGWEYYDFIASYDGMIHHIPSWSDGEKTAVFKKDYRPNSPDSPASQLLGVIEAMREKGWLFNLTYYTKDGTELDYWLASFYGPCKGLPKKFWGKANTLPEAVCLAAKKALESHSN